MANHEMGARDLLLAAARLVERALLQLDGGQAPCCTCGRDLHRNIWHGRLLGQLGDLPDKLRRAAEQVDLPSEPSPAFKASHEVFMRGGE